jgi:hypothetical protein
VKPKDKSVNLRLPAQLLNAVQDRAKRVGMPWSGMGLGWGLFLLVARTQRSKRAARRGPLYFAWGCFRDFCPVNKSIELKLTLLYQRFIRMALERALHDPK